MAEVVNGDRLIEILRETIVSVVQSEGRDLTARQLSVFLSVYLLDGPHTVRGLAAALNVNKPAISRAFDRLSEFVLARPAKDPADRRSVILHRTHMGAGFLEDLRRTMADAERATRDMKPIENVGG